MRIQSFPDPRPPGEIPIAGVTLSDLLGEVVPVAEAQLALNNVPRRAPNLMLRPGDELRRFRTPAWTWANMGGIEGIAVIRSGRVEFFVITRMN